MGSGGKRKGEDKWIVSRACGEHTFCVSGEEKGPLDRGGGWGGGPEEGKNLE